MKPVLVTGVAGFIGSQTAHALLDAGREVVGVDHLGGALAAERLSTLSPRRGFTFYRHDLTEMSATRSLFGTVAPSRVVHLAASAGVRRAVEHPREYADNNLVAFVSVCEAARHARIDHLIFASSSSVYGANPHRPSSVHECAARPLSLYAATKIANEAIAYSYAHQHGLACTGLRFFTVYGPWGRPDMAVFAFTRKILAGEPLRLFNGGDMRRDFTYIDDVTRIIMHLIERCPEPPPTGPPSRVLNVGAGRPVSVRELVEVLEQALGVQAVCHHAPMSSAEVQVTHAQLDAPWLEPTLRPATTLREGVGSFVEWYRSFHEV
ncbi:MAG: NAD-dependent epimerase/dehydratase family protein [Deltaproteobacteria bacterium]|nr:MAG: NAD-dependent epimerase/dehydratase family protein [Deltaproteobacteria bacterium]